MREIDLAIDFISAAEAAETMAELEDKLARVLAEFDVSNFSIIVAPCRRGDATRRPMGLTNSIDRAWSDHYRQEKYYNSDPVVHSALRQTNPFTWDDLNLPARSQAARQQVAEGRDQLKVDGCFAIPIHDTRGFSGLVSMLYHGGPLSESRRRALHLMAIYAVEKAKELRGADSDEAGWEALCPLTVRQREILAYSAIGKTAGEIGDLLNISEKTAVHHFENAKALLGAATRTAAVAMAIQRGWVVL